MIQQRPDWFDNAKPVECFVVDIGFLVLPALFIGDENDPDQFGSSDPVIIVPLPEISYVHIPKGSRGSFALLADETHPSWLTTTKRVSTSASDTASCLQLRSTVFRCGR